MNLPKVSLRGKDGGSMALALRPPVVIETDADLVRVSRDNPGYQFEREADSTIVVSPTHSKGAAKSGEAYGQLRDCRKRVGGSAFESSTGFAVGPAARVYSPDASWVSQPRIDALTQREKSGFWPLSPDVVIEVRSDSDSFSDVEQKIAVYRERGTTYAVASDPQARDVVELGEPPAGLALDFDAIIDA
jgi:Uma2 family endonuclease